jgi:membrane-associated phospholipid phosphatase
VSPTHWINRFSTPWLDEYLQLAYMSYYFIPIITGAALYNLQGDDTFEPRESFRRAVVVFLVTFYLSYLGYLLVPAVGPRFTLHYTKELNGVLLTPYLKRLINILEPTHHDCFPSGHTAISVVALLIAFRYRRRVFWWLLPVVCSLIVSTVYHRYHYVIDVIAGVALGFFSFFLGEWLFDMWKRRWG